MSPEGNIFWRRLCKQVRGLLSSVLSPSLNPHSPHASLPTLLPPTFWALRMGIIQVKVASSACVLFYWHHCRHACMPEFIQQTFSEHLLTPGRRQRIEMCNTGGPCLKEPSVRRDRCIITCQTPPSHVPCMSLYVHAQGFLCVSNFRCSSSNVSKHPLVTCVCLHGRPHTSAKPVGVGCAEIFVCVNGTWR